MGTKKIPKLRIDDYIGIRVSLRHFMKEAKTLKHRSERIARIRFLKELRREIDGYLVSRGLVRPGLYKRR